MVAILRLVRIEEADLLENNFFNLLNMPGLTAPRGDSGILSLQSSYNSPRQMQLTLRVQF